MKFRTEIEIAPYASEAQIGYDTPTLALGSCFAEEMTARLRQLRFPCTTNPTGVLFNPASVAQTLRSFTCPELIPRGELHQTDGVWSHFGFHGSFSDPDPDAALTRMNAARQAGAEALRNASHLILTFGTAWVFEREGRIVTNCHRRPGGEFVRRRLRVGQIVEEYAQLLEGLLAGKHIILTVSPVRHAGDGLQGNAVSKAVLRLAAAELAERYEQVHYFPAYEIINDDLRDYRFYADDLMHPAPQAVEYIWEKFSGALLANGARHTAEAVAQIAAAALHRPQHPESEAFRTFCREQVTRIERLPGVDLSQERAYFEKYLQ